MTEVSVRIPPSVTPSDACQTGVLRYIQLFETLSPACLQPGALFDQCVAEKVYFKDPFNAVRGREAYRAILDHMFRTTQSVTFTVTDHSWGRDGVTVYLRWTFTAHVKALGKDPWIVDGLSEITLDTAGLVTSHIDHWDAAEKLYARIPVIGGLLRFIRRRMTAAPARH